MDSNCFANKGVEAGLRTLSLKQTDTQEVMMGSGRCVTRKTDMSESGIGED